MGSNWVIKTPGLKPWCLFYPSLRSQDKTVKACLCLNCLEFDVIEIRIMEMLPKPEEGMDWMMRNIPSRLAKFSF